MPQKTNLNISPYYDDFDKSDNFYRMLFKPGFPVQARELTGLQSILQNQIESFGSHIFKEGSMVIPGGVTYDNSFYSVKVNPDHLGIDVTVYLDALIKGKVRLKGQESKVIARLDHYVLPPNEGVEEITLFVKYLESGDTGTSTPFPDGETLILQDNTTYGNTTLNAGDTVFTAVKNEACKIGSAVGLAEGVYFIRGTFVDVPTTRIVLEPYSNTPSYRVGLDILEEIITSNDDETLNDNAAGFTNFAAPGADRFKISVKLTKKSLQDYEDTTFVELLRVEKGEVKKIQNSSVYSEIRKYFAKRTFEESGNYAIDPFRVEIANSLNDEIDNGGLYLEGEKTSEGNDPDDDLMCVKVSPGTAYVRGFDIDLIGSTTVDVEKPRDTKEVKQALVPFKMGSTVKVNNVYGTPYIAVGDNTATNIVYFYNRRRGTATNATFPNLGIKVGQARVYSYGVADAPYEGAKTQWELSLWDVQTFTTLKTTTRITAQEAPVGSYVKGQLSGATGYLAEHRVGFEINVSQTSGTFITGEKLSFNGSPTYNASVSQVIQYTTDDIKSIYQNASAGTALQTNFLADTVLYNSILPKFSATDILSISVAGIATCSGRLFAGSTGIRTDAIISYQDHHGSDPTYNIVDEVRADGATIKLVKDIASISGVSNDDLPSATVGGTVNSRFGVGIPKFSSLEDASLYTELPKLNTESVDLSDSSLTITRQIPSLTVSSSTLTITSDNALDTSSGINSCFFESFDAERYSIHYSNGTTEKLTQDQFQLSDNSERVTFTGLTNGSNVTAIVTLRKVNVSSKNKTYSRSTQLIVNKTSGVDTTAGLTTNTTGAVKAPYGLRVEDDEISLGVCDVDHVVAVYESTDENDPSVDKLTFVSGLGLNTNAVIGEKIVGKDSRAIAQLVTRDSATQVGYVYLNGNKFQTGESVTLKESNITANIQEITKGNYLDKTNNYNLNKGHKDQYCDYSRIVRKSGSQVPSKRLLIIFNNYTVSGNSGDLFTVNSYTKDRYTDGIPLIGSGKKFRRASDVLDFRPRVKNYTSAHPNSDISPFTFDAREFQSTFKYAFTPNESSQVGYKYYLPRIDRLTINRLGEVSLIKGTSADPPKAPVDVDDAMDVAEITLPPYLYSPSEQPIIKLFDNRRYTMRDIGQLERRIINLETVTSLTMLEMDTKSLEVTDAQGLSRFKTGFIVDNFSNKDFIDGDVVDSRCDIDVENNHLISAVDFWSMQADLAYDPGIDLTKENPDESDLKLLDPNIQKTGDLLTLAYKEVEWIKQAQATQVENVNPFNVVVFVGAVVLDPPSDNWVRTIYINDHRTESTGAEWIEHANTSVIGRSTNTDTETDTVWHSNTDGTRTTTTTTTTDTTTRTRFHHTLEGPTREFDYVENVKVSGDADPFMRSRNVYFAANGLKPFTSHYPYLDSQTGIDIMPRLIEIQMKSGTFQVGEHVRIFKDGNWIGYVNAQRPNWKFHDKTSPAIAAGLGSPSVYGEDYNVDPYDRTRPAPGNTYSPTSRLFNAGVRKLAHAVDGYFGYCVKGARLVGMQSGAEAEATRVELISDNWGDLLGSFYFRPPNSTPAPAIRVRSGTKTFKVSAAPPGTTPLPGSTAYASDAQGTYSGSGVVLKQETSRVSVRNPAKPADKPDLVVTTRTTDVDVDVTAVRRDPLAQSFTVDPKGAFLTSVDVYFAAKDPQAKIFFEVREVELGLPTNFLVQDYAQVALNPNNIQVSSDASVATNIKLPSPLYLEGDKEYAIVFLSPQSDLYEMWCATMGQKTVKTSNLPDVQNVVVSKQYIGGSLFKSQNGTIWTPSQYQDLTFTLYKAEFVPSGTATFYNSPILPRNQNAAIMDDNPFRTLPRKLKVGIDGGTNANLIPGAKISQGATTLDDDESITGIVEKIGAAAATVGLATGGFKYPNGNTTSVSTYNITGQGSGLVVTLAGNSNGQAMSASVTSAGSGYVVGDQIGLTTSSITGKVGYGAVFSIDTISATTDTLYLTNVQGEAFANNEDVIYYNGATRTTAGSVKIDGASSVVDQFHTGNILEISQRNHAHHGANNKLDIEGILPDTKPVQVTADFDVNSDTVSVATTAPFASMGGITTNTGYALLDNEVVHFSTAVNALVLDERGVNGTVKKSHAKGSIVYPYEVNGLSLIGINTTHDIPTNISIRDQYTTDKYYIEAYRPADRNSGVNQVSFFNEKSVGGGVIQVGTHGGPGVSQNHQFSSITPQFNTITPGKGTQISAQVRTVSGSSAGGNEASFIDQGYDSVALNKVFHFPTPRMVASKINESTRLTTLPRNKSLTMRVDFKSVEPDLSPVLDVKNAIFILGRNKINKPVSDYATDSRSNDIVDDPHGSVFVTKRVNLKQPATSLQVLVAANRTAAGDFRVFYQLFKTDSSEVKQKFIPFPGYDNLIDDDGDGYGDRVIDPRKNNGRPDAKVPANVGKQFSEYQFTADHLGQFDGFVVKIVMTSTNESEPITLKDFRAIALA